MAVPRRGRGRGRRVEPPPPPPPPLLPPPPEGEDQGEAAPQQLQQQQQQQQADPNAGADQGLQQPPEMQLLGGAGGSRRGAAAAAGGGGGGGPGRRGPRGDGQRPEGSRVLLGVAICQQWLRGILQAIGIARADSKIWLTLVLAAVAGILHWFHMKTLFENNRHFSHLSTLEREMAFRTEMGLYYSYYKTIVEAPSFLSGVLQIMADNITEYPCTINTLKRFHLYPEVVLASWYRIYRGTTDAFGIQTQKCWTVSRGEGISSVESCEGLGDPASFYVAIIFLLNGLMVAVFFLYGTYLSGHRSGGLLTVACFFFNHSESTRVMWTPPLRESFSYPFLVIQMLLLTYILRTQNVNRGSLIALSVSNVFFMLPWRFAQFVLLTQVASVFSIYILGFIDSSKLHKILCAHMASLAVCFVLMFGNSMFLTSYYTASLVICQGILVIRPIYLRTYKHMFPLWAIEAFSCLLGTIAMKPFLCLILGVTNHVYIINLIKAKITNYKDFNTLMYTCAVEFDFMEKETPVKYMKTLLLPVVLAVFVAIVVKVFQHILHCKNVAARQRDLNHGEMVFHAFQLIFFAILAILIMRLKLFLTPHMCIMASLICSKQLFGWIYHKIPRRTFVLAILALMAGEGIRNLQKDWSMVGEFRSLHQEELLLWIKANTKQDAVFGGTLPITSSVKLSTLRPVVNHPHYEDTVIQPKMKILYSMYSRKSAKEVKMELLKMGVNYYILEEAWCPKKPKSGCTMPEIWDVEDKSNAGKVPLCTLMSRDSRPYFRTVFSNYLYKVLEVSRE